MKLKTLPVDENKTR